MCIVFYSTAKAGYKLILASNRDEFLDRPATPADWHNFNGEAKSEVLSGLDLGSAAHGTWLGITKSLRIGIITNIRQTGAAPGVIPGKPSRGALLKSFLCNQDSVADFSRSLKDGAELYDGFNLLMIALDKEGIQIGHLSNRPQAVTHDLSSAQRRVQGMSNSPLNEPWPKVIQGEEVMEKLLDGWKDEEEGIEALMRLLKTQTPLTTLADATRCTCIPPIRIGKDPARTPLPEEKARWYGTRVSTVILIRDNNEVVFVERDVSSLVDGEVRADQGERRYTFKGLEL